jgi:hypothetical protein
MPERTHALPIRQIDVRTGLNQQFGAFSVVAING